MRLSSAVPVRKPALGPRGCPVPQLLLQPCIHTCYIERWALGRPPLHLRVLSPRHTDSGNPVDSQGGDRPQRDLGARRQEMGQGEVLRWSPALHFECIVIVPVKKVRISSYVQVSLDKILVKALFSKENWARKQLHKNSFLLLILD